MTYNRRQIMIEAWTIVRRFQGNGESLSALLSHALQSAWFKAKINAEAQARTAAIQAKRDALNEMTSVQLQARITDMENRDRLGHEGIEELAALQHAYYAAADLQRKRDLIVAAHGQFASVTFTKKDGTPRQMRVQPAQTAKHVKGAEASQAGQKATLTRSVRHPHLLPVWDVDAQGIRSINLATVTRIAAGGQVHSFAS